MRLLLLLCVTTGFVGCSGSEQQSDVSATPSLQQFAGTWSVDYMAEGSDSVVVTTRFHATSTTEGWTLILPDRDPIPVRVVPGGDSVLIHAGPFESVLRAGVMVTTEGAIRRVGDMLEAWVVARYTTTGPDSVARLRGRGTRVQMQ